MARCLVNPEAGISSWASWAGSGSCASQKSSTCNIPEAGLTATRWARSPRCTSSCKRSPRRRSAKPRSSNVSGSRLKTTSGRRRCSASIKSPMAETCPTTTPWTRTGVPVEIPYTEKAGRKSTRTKGAFQARHHDHSATPHVSTRSVSNTPPRARRLIRRTVGSYPAT